MILQKKLCFYRQSYDFTKKSIILPKKLSFETMIKFSHPEKNFCWTIFGEHPSFLKRHLMKFSENTEKPELNSVRDERHENSLLRAKTL